MNIQINKDLKSVKQERNHPSHIVFFFIVFIASMKEWEISLDNVCLYIIAE